MMKKRIVWITADYFIDVDCLLVPYLQQNYADEYQIDWYVIKTANSNIPIPCTPNRTFALRHRGKDPRIILEYARFFKTLHLEKADIIYSDFVGVPYYYFVLSKYNKNKVPLVHAAHNVIPYDVWPKSLIWYIDKVFRKNQHFHFFSKFTMEYFKEHYRGKSYYYCPMTLKGYSKVTTDNYHLDTNKVNLLFFGNVVDNKRLDLLIDTIKSLPEDLADCIHLSICGNCKTPEKYMSQIGKAKNISVHFKRIDDCEVAELFTKHSYLILPYEAVAQSGPHMIAYYYNLPVIASNIEGFTERIEDGKNGFLFQVNNKVDLIRVINQVVNMEQEKYKQLKENLKKYSSEHFDLENISQKYIDYFQTILGQSHI